MNGMIQRRSLKINTSICFVPFQTLALSLGSLCNVCTASAAKCTAWFHGDCLLMRFSRGCVSWRPYGKQGKRTPDHPRCAPEGPTFPNLTRGISSDGINLLHSPVHFFMCKALHDCLGLFRKALRTSFLGGFLLCSCLDFLYKARHGLFSFFLAVVLLLVTYSTLYSQRQVLLRRRRRFVAVFLGLLGGFSQFGSRQKSSMRTARTLHGMSVAGFM